MKEINDKITGKNKEAERSVIYEAATGVVYAMHIATGSFFTAFGAASATVKSLGETVPRHIALAVGFIGILLLVEVFRMMIDDSAGREYECLYLKFCRLFFRED